MFKTTYDIHINYRFKETFQSTDFRKNLTEFNVTLTKQTEIRILITQNLFLIKSVNFNPFHIKTKYWTFSLYTEFFGY